ncbi:MAG: Lrp/AsnC family transcriptional regulator [Solirubrobacteraceae bacterium]|nr:Lrp/AsnC family transcriptional regulator [Solirubrobacteraceae bacterium]
MDEIDREIVHLLVEDARMSFRELGERVALSANATAERVKRLRERGIIAGYQAIIDPGAAGLRLGALVDVRLATPDASERFERLVTSLAAITDCAHVTGRFDYALRVVCGDPGELDTIIRTLKTKGGVTETDTRIALRTVVSRPGPVAFETAPLPGVTS